MAPKPVEKKSAQKKAPSYVPRELDVSRYIRKVRVLMMSICFRNILRLIKSLTR